MPNRTFRQYALGFGDTPAVVSVALDGNIIYSGQVTTLDEPFPTLPNPGYEIDNIAWSWEDAPEFSGTKQLSISVTGSPLMLAQTLANQPYITPDLFGSFWSITVDGVEYWDPLTEEKMNGQPLSGPYRPDETGQWWWRIPVGATFTALLNITAAEYDPDADPPPNPA